MTVLVIAGMTLATVAALGHPFTRRRAALALDIDLREQELTTRKESLFGDIRDLEMDRRTDKVSAEDYKRMRTGLEVEAAHVLEEIESTEIVHNERACTDCGQKIGVSDRFCGHCGSSTRSTTHKGGGKP